MLPLKEVHLTYPVQRDVVFILGAGASYPDGVPLQDHIIPLMLSTENNPIISSAIGGEVVEFINDNFAYSFEENQFPKLEAVFGFLDYFIQQNEIINKKYHRQKLLDIRENLIKVIHYLVNLNTEKKSEIYQRFWNAVFKNNTNISIITLNYDTLLEQSFEGFFRVKGYIDYALDLMNYQKLESTSKFNFWVDPTQPMMINDDESPSAIKIIKLHGSLNWKFCTCCNQTLLTPWDRIIDLNKGKFLGYTYPEKEAYEYRCPIDDTEFETLILPPSFVKPLNHPIVTTLMIEAAKEIRSAKRIVFVGYSLSYADLHIKALLKKNIVPGTEIIVINKKKNKNFLYKYKSLSNNIKFVKCSFEQLLSDDEMIGSVFS